MTSINTLRSAKLSEIFFIFLDSNNPELLQFSFEQVHLISLFPEDHLYHKCLSPIKFQIQDGLIQIQPCDCNDQNSVTLMIDLLRSGTIDNVLDFHIKSGMINPDFVFYNCGHVVELFFDPTEDEYRFIDHLCNGNNQQLNLSSSWTEEAL